MARMMHLFSTILFRVLLKILKLGDGNRFKGNLISARENWFFGQWKLTFSIFLLLVKTTFCLTKTYFKRICHSVWWRRIFYLMETVFSYMILFLYEWKPSLKFVPIERNFPPSGICFLLFSAFFLQVETLTETSWIKQSVLFINVRSSYLNKKQYQFDRDSKITVNQLTFFTLS